MSHYYASDFYFNKWKLKKIKIYYANDLCANMSKLNNLLKYHNVDLHVFFCSVFLTFCKWKITSDSLFKREW